MTALRLSRRKTRTHIPQVLGLILLLMVGVCFFITLFTIVERYVETAEAYFDEYHYADMTFYGAFDDGSIEAVSGQPGAKAASGRMVRDYRAGERVFRVISLSEGLNLPYLYEGRLPQAADECLLLRRNATAMQLAIGDTLAIDGKMLTITGLAASPEYIYMVQNERAMMASPDGFAVLFVAEAFYPGGYNEIVAAVEDGFSAEAVAEAIGAHRTVWQADQQNYTLYLDELGMLTSFAYIFPFIFAVLIAVVIYVMLSRTIQKDRKQIGAMKALGMKDGRIVRIYLAPFCIAALAGGVLGCFAAMFISDTIIGIFLSLFEVPTLGFVLYPALWAGAVIVSVALCAVSGGIAMLWVLPLLPAEAMRPRAPKGGKHLLVQRIGFLWARLSFNTRYALNNALRNKGRFLAVVLGICGSCALLTFSLGFNDSIGHTQDQYFDGFAHYDVIITFDPQPLAIDHPAMPHADQGYKALVMPVAIGAETYTLAAVEEGFDMINIPLEAAQNGIILPAFYAQEWGVGAGDTMEIDGHIAEIAAVTPQYLGLTLYTSFDYLSTLMEELPPVYNALYARSGDMAGLTAFLQEQGMTFGTIDDDRTSFDSIMESMSVLIWFMIGCSVVLGFTVLYSVGLINLSAREFEYMFMGVMGYPHKAIMAAHRKETLIQLILAIPLGFAAGNLLLESIKGEFSGTNFVISSAIRPGSYAVSALLVIGVAAIIALVTSRHVGKLDIVEGLKEQDA
ncbi:MAG: ABC transporter permease [Oscillospiraceae bacterium]|jgi:putative ABC transport system permease protein|nr:ABC transporter permease [Oscillospiraceae bacterium]